MSLEGKVQREVWLELGRDCRLFRVNTGKAWLSGAGPAQRLKDGSVLVPAGRPIALGLALPNGDPLVGCSDLLGWTPVVVTADMVGQTLPVLTAIETKRTKGGRATQEQLHFVGQVVQAGGIAGVANSPESARAILGSWHARFSQDHPKSLDQQHVTKK